MTILKLLASWRGLLALAMLALLSACVVDEGPGPRPIPDDEFGACTEE